MQNYEKDLRDSIILGNKKALHMSEELAYLRVVNFAY